MWKLIWYVNLLLLQLSETRTWLFLRCVPSSLSCTPHVPWTAASQEPDLGDWEWLERNHSAARRGWRRRVVSGPAWMCGGWSRTRPLRWKRIPRERDATERRLTERRGRKGGSDGGCDVQYLTQINKEHTQGCSYMLVWRGQKCLCSCRAAWRRCWPWLWVRTLQGHEMSLIPV